MTQGSSTDGIAVAMLVTAMVSIQTGSAIAVGIFDDLAPISVVFVRTAASGLFLYLIWRPGAEDFKRDWRLSLKLGFTLVGMTIFFYGAIDRIPLGTTVTLEFVGPLGIALLNSTSRKDWIWVAVAAVGVAMLGGGFGGSGVDPIGSIMALIAGGFWGLYIHLGRQLGRDSGDNKRLVLPVLIAATIVAPLGIAEGASDLFDLKILLICAGIGLLSSAIPFSLDMYALRRVPANVFGVLMSLEPVIAAGIGFLILGQAMSSVEILAIGCVAVAAGGILRTGKPRPADL